MSRLLRVLVGLASLAAPLGAQGNLPTWTLREDWRLRSDAVDLIQVQGLTVMADGGFIVVAGQDRQIHRFDASGRLRFSAGREGRGPGEFVAPQTARVTGDSVWVWDLLARRLTIFGPTGRYVRSVELAGTWPLRADTPPLAGRRSGGLMPDFVTAEGDIVGWTTVAASGPGDVSRSLLVRVGRDSMAHILSDRLGYDNAAVSWRAADNTGGSIMIPFAPRPLSGASADGRRIVTAQSSAKDGTTSELRLRVVDAVTGSVADHRASFPAVTVTRARRDSAMNVTRNVAGRGFGGARVTGPPAGTFADVESRIPPTADLLPGARQLMVAPDGTMFVPLQTADHPAPRYAVFAPNGRQTGWFSVPKGVFLRAATATHVWAAVPDEDGFPHIVRFAIVR
jgi:hypothetical protein